MMACHNWRSLWHLLLFMLLQVCFPFDLAPPMATMAFPNDQEPARVVGLEHTYKYPGFQGLLHDNDTQRLGLNFQTMIRVNKVLYIAARDRVFAMNLTTAADDLAPHLMLTWRSDDVGKCTVRGKNGDECYNFIKVLVPRDDETLFACGTNAFNPACRNYKMSSLEQVGDDLLGQARCPFESVQSNVALFAGGDFYSATLSDFLASDAVIYRSLGEGRPVLRTVKYDSKWLREPHFLHAVDYGNYVYFFLREIAVEYTALGKVVFSRVARVCKNDNGGSPRVLERYWTSFLKARLNCSIAGESFFYFDVLQSVTSVLQLNQRPAVVGVFTTQANSIPGSAVCAFYMDDIQEVFNRKFKEQRSAEATWTPVPEEQVPEPRPGICAGDGAAADYESSVRFPDEMLAFIKSHPLMDEAVPSVNEQPCFTRTTSRSTLTRIAVDVSAGPFKNHTVMFLGSNDGRVLKVLFRSLPSGATSDLLEEIHVYNPAKCDIWGQEDRRVLALELDKEHHALFVAFSSCVIRVPLSRCAQYCRRLCLTSRDPYCIWLPKTGSCASSNSMALKSDFEQQVDGDSFHGADTCNAEIMATARNQESPADSAYGVGGPLEGQQESGAHVHYTLLLACVFAAFLFGAVLSAFMVSCYCNRGSGHQRARGLGKDPETSLSLRSLAKLSGLLDGHSKEVKLSTQQMYSSFVPGGVAESHVPSPRHLGDPALSLSQSLSQTDGELSGLPTPDSTPERPLKVLRQQDSKPVPSFMAVLGNSMTQQVFPFPHHHGNTGGGGVSQSVVDVSALDELLKHIHEVSASGTGGIKVLTSTSSSSLIPGPSLPGPHCNTRTHHYNQQQVPELYYSTSVAPQNAPPSTSTPLQQIPERALSRHHSQRHPLIKMGGRGVPRHHSFNQGGANFLARMNTNSSSNGPNKRVLTANTCLTRQHSYSEGPPSQRAPAVRRTVSMKPQMTTKPLLLPNTAPLTPAKDY
ncbi:sema domain, transmembrane domain (TM), and cytoplasmic domain, (semaphorin) 6C [Neosynchiropus ocellatus]